MTCHGILMWARHCPWSWRSGLFSLTMGPAPMKLRSYAFLICPLLALAPFSQSVAQDMTPPECTSSQEVDVGTASNDYRFVLRSEVCLDMLDGDDSVRILAGSSSLTVLLGSGSDFVRTSALANGVSVVGGEGADTGERERTLRSALAKTCESGAALDRTRFRPGFLTTGCTPGQVATPSCRALATMS